MDTPLPEGVTLWAKLNRQTVNAFLALGRGQFETAAQIAADILAQASQYPLYRLRAGRLAQAERLPASNFPRIMWAVLS